MPITFTKVALPYGWLGNMSPFVVEWRGRHWRTSEALFQSLRFKDSEIIEEIYKQLSPMAAKFLAKKHADKMVVVPMSMQDVDFMKQVLIAKLRSNPNLRKLLLETGEETIIEDVTSRNRPGNHRFWGAALINDEWVGDNVLGKLWMKVRQECREADESQESS